MREIDVNLITETVAQLCIDANIYLNDDIKNALIENAKKEENKIAKNILNVLVENADIASKELKPICQDTGMAIIYMDIGMDVHFTGGNLTDAINKGVALGYTKGYLRKSVLNDPIDRKNTNDNTPAIIHYNIVDGDKVKITAAPKGFGSENMSKIKMLPPSAGIEGVKEFVYETIKTAASNACPPMIIGIGLGGSMEKCADIAKRALLREVGTKNEDIRLQKLEEELLENINKMNIGPSGFGGRTTALAVHINMYAAHITSLPVCVCTGCHVTRHKEIIL
ncbi:fumarate hydratase [Brachyspira hyodysenteriae]|uniref:fumarate hydratase n=1 Tax=Brachyspira hyodysenteriae TaxID=159 RepID=UPI002B260320|nr:fumarate hydratase [Brachyspira hyodysenteriae]WPC39033.1 fumarate hydratase [Brachyspira hyodysenteriae]